MLPVRSSNRSLAVVSAVILSTVASARIARAGVNSWTTSGPTTGAIQLLVADPTGESSVYAGVAGPVLFNLKDNAWRIVADGTGSSFPDLYSVAVDPSNPRTIYAGVSGSLFAPTATGGLYRSTDGGHTWGLLDVHKGYPVFSVVIDPLAVETIYAVASECICGPPHYCYIFGPSCNSQIYKSSDAGLTWTSKGALSLVKGLTIDSLLPSTLYAITFGSVLKSLDGGATWTVMSAGLSGQYLQELAISPANPKVLFLATMGGSTAPLFKSTNGGLTWEPTSLTFDQVGGVRSIAVDPTNEDVLYVTGNDVTTEFMTKGRLFRSTDGGRSWTRFDAGLPDTDFGPVTVERDGETIHVAIDQKGVFDYTYVPPLKPRVRAVPRSPAAVPFR